MPRFKAIFFSSSVNCFRLLGFSTNKTSILISGVSWSGRFKFIVLAKKGNVATLFLGEALASSVMLEDATFRLKKKVVISFILLTRFVTDKIKKNERKG